MAAPGLDLQGAARVHLALRGSKLAEGERGLAGRGPGPVMADAGVKACAELNSPRRRVLAPVLQFALGHKSMSHIYVYHGKEREGTLTLLKPAYTSIPTPSESGSTSGLHFTLKALHASPRPVFSLFLLGTPLCLKVQNVQHYIPANSTPPTHTSLVCS